MKVKKSTVNVFTIEYDIDDDGRPNSPITINKVQYRCPKNQKGRLQLIEHGVAENLKRIGSIPSEDQSVKSNREKSIAWTENNCKLSDTEEGNPFQISDATTFTKTMFRSLASKIKDSLAMKLFSSILIPSFAILYSMIVTLWPQNNIILDPEYWYEPIAPFILGYIFIVTATGIVDCSMVLKTDVILSWKAFFTIFVAHSVGFLFPYISIYLFWVHLLGFRYPMPFTGHVCYLVGSLFKGIQLWFYFPSEMKAKNKAFRKRLLAYLSFFPLQIVLAQGLSLLEMLFFTVPLNMQLWLGILLPIVKKFNLWWTSEIAFRAAGGKEISARIAMICWISCTHSLWIALMINKVTFETACVLMILDSIPNVLLFLKIIRLQKRRKTKTSIKEAEESLVLSENTMDFLALREFFEILIPSVYCLTFVIAFHGPNAEVIGNVRNGYWQYVKVNNNHCYFIFFMTFLSGAIFFDKFNFSYTYR